MFVFYCIFKDQSFRKIEENSETEPSAPFPGASYPKVFQKFPKLVELSLKEFSNLVDLVPPPLFSRGPPYRHL